MLSAHPDPNVLVRIRACAGSRDELVSGVLHACRRVVCVARQAFQRDVAAEGDEVGRAEGAVWIWGTGCG